MLPFFKILTTLITHTIYLSYLLFIILLSGVGNNSQTRATRLLLESILTRITHINSIT